MNIIIRFFLTLLAIASAFAVLVAISFAYEWIRRKLNKPRIGGIELFLCKILSRDDYVCIEGRVYCFSHIAQAGKSIDILSPPLNDNMTIGGELAFYNPRSLGYIMMYDYALRKCEFIYGKCGLKWAASRKVADSAVEKVNEYKMK